jgi:hypothetical protein
MGKRGMSGRSAIQVMKVLNSANMVRNSQLIEDVGPDHFTLGYHEGKRLEEIWEETLLGIHCFPIWLWVVEGFALGHKAEET